MAGGGSSELRSLRLRVADLERAAMDVVSSLRMVGGRLKVLERRQAELWAIKPRPAKRKSKAKPRGK